MTGQATVRLMADGRRLHLQHGPIDIVAEAFGKPEEIETAYKQGAVAFSSILSTLVEDLSVLKRPVSGKTAPAMNGLSQTLWNAARQFSDDYFVTAMAAVAGAVADHVKAAMLKGRRLEKLYVNNGGDIALFLDGSSVFTSGIVNNQDAPSIDAKITLSAQDGIGGVATSGWRGRSLSPGIADAVTVLANCAATADVAATLIAGHVFVKSPAVVQKPAFDVRDDTDLGEMMVTTDVGPLTEAEKKNALAQGMRVAKNMREAGLIQSAYFALQGQSCSLLSDEKVQIRKIA
ncbi:UPF0280 family protein [Sneathiella sp.]|uniref:UPF0280 family protein n=1 Tax=Sneathiella sp. TaxID=1964365 RepID=UPI0039E2A6B7